MPDQSGQSKPIVAIVGRPNVGKSTLFNRLIGTRTALTSDIAGTTRDRLFGDGEWLGRELTFVDTGGLTEDDDEMANAINGRVKTAVEEADLVVFLLDVATGVLPEDRAAAEYLRKTGKPLIVAANKTDSPERERVLGDFFELGMGAPIAISAIHGRGIGDLLDAILERVPEREVGSEPERMYPALAILGRPNVGKSTLYNKLSGSPERITSDVPHTTRDIAVTDIQTAEGPLRVIDTAGVQRRGRSGVGLVKYSLLRTLRAMGEADVVVLLLDATEGPTVQDAHISAYALEAGKPLVVAVNKWDLVEKTPDVQDRFYDQLAERLGFLPQPPVVFISAMTGEKLDRLVRAVCDVWEITGRRIETAELNRVLKQHLDRLPGISGRRPPKLYYATQVATHPPTIALFVNNTKSWADNHRRFITNVIRDEFGLLGTPIELKLRPKGEEVARGRA